jgi:hypothetical protein
MDNDDNSMARLYTSPSHHRLVVEQQATDTTFKESYWLPPVSTGLTADMGYRFLTNKGMVDHKGEALIVNSSGNDIDYKVLGAAAVKDWTNAITQNSTHLVTSGAVYTGLAGKLNLSGGTLTGPLTAPNFFVKKDGYAEPLKIFDASGQLRIMFTLAENTDQFSIRTSKPGSKADIYTLPAPEAQDKAVWYNILTSKNPVTVAQGGTGATDAVEAANNMVLLTLANLAETPKNNIGKNANLDGFTRGVFRCPDAATAATISNTPVTNVGFRLIASQHTTSTSYFQILIAYSNNVDVYMRVKTSSWGNWKKLNFS